MSIPVGLVIIILFLFRLNWKNTIYAVSRMLIQLFIIGYFLSYIFLSTSSILILSILLVMIFIASWIALRTIPINRLELLSTTFISIIIGGGITLIFVSQFVMNLDPWYIPRYILPIAGMIFASSMNGVSLAAERLKAELDRNISYKKAKAIAFKTALIPITNSLFAVGIVSLPGMMTGQILSGVSPLIAVRYQIMVMSMIFSAVGLSSFVFLFLAESKIVK